MATAIITIIMRIFKPLSLISKERRAPTKPPTKAPAARKSAWTYSGWPKKIWVIRPEDAANNKMN